MQLRLSLFLIFSLSVSCHALSKTDAKKVLYIGDSQSAGFLGNLVFQDLKKSYPADDIDVFGVSSSSPRHWGDTQSSQNGSWLCKRKGRHNDQFPIPLKNLICSGPNSKASFENLLGNKYDHVFFQFLGNSAAFSEEFIKEKVSQLLSYLNKEKCVFITTPPHYHTLKKANTKRVKVESYFIEAINGRCTIVQGMSDENLKKFAKVKAHYQPDNKHLSRKGAEEFFKQIQPHLP